MSIHPQGIILIEPIVVRDYIDLTADPALIDLGKLKDVLLLPERYVVEEVRHIHVYYDLALIIVSSPDIHKVPEDEELPHVTLCCLHENCGDGKTRTVSLADIKINGVSVIKEEDKQRKVIVEIKDIVYSTGGII